MVEGKRIAEWDHTAQLLAIHSEKAIHPDKLNPYRKKLRKIRRSRDSFTRQDLYAWAKSLELAQARKAAQGG